MRVVCSVSLRVGTATLCLLLLAAHASATPPAGRSYAVTPQLQVPGLEWMPADCWRFSARGSVVCSRLFGCARLSIQQVDSFSTSWSAVVRFPKPAAMAGVVTRRGRLAIRGWTELRAPGTSIGGTLLGCFHTPLTTNPRSECFNGGFIGLQDRHGCPSLKRALYRSGFETLALGSTEPYPGGPMHDGWYSAQAGPAAFGEMQAEVANPGQALHQLASQAGPAGLQTIDKRALEPPDLDSHPYIHLGVDFYTRTSDPQAKNTFDAYMALRGGPHPGFELLGFNLASGNGEAKSVAGVSVRLASFNGVDNNQPVPLSVGQGLAWEAWHRLVLVADQRQDRYLSIRVDGDEQELTAFALPRSEIDGAWFRGALIEEVLAQVVPTDNFGASTDDSVYWDNLVVEVSRSPFPG